MSIYYRASPAQVVAEISGSGSGRRPFRPYGCRPKGSAPWSARKLVVARVHWERHRMTKTRLEAFSDGVLAIIL
ncbi:MAG TPA: hypothetical protein VK842_06930, partial [bacterium]|nr:hypothetical protein [bacterium]